MPLWSLYYTIISINKSDCKFRSLWDQQFFYDFIFHNLIIFLKIINIPTNTNEKNDIKKSQIKFKSKKKKCEIEHLVNLFFYQDEFLQLQLFIYFSFACFNLTPSLSYQIERESATSSFCCYSVQVAFVFWIFNFF